MYDQIIHWNKIESPAIQSFSTCYNDDESLHISLGQIPSIEIRDRNWLGILWSIRPFFYLSPNALVKRIVILMISYVRIK